MAVPKGFFVPFSKNKSYMHNAEMNCIFMPASTFFISIGLNNLFFF